MKVQGQTSRVDEQRESHSVTRLLRKRKGVGPPRTACLWQFYRPRNADPLASKRATESCSLLLSARTPVGLAFARPTLLMPATFLRFAERFPVIVTVELAAVIVTGWWWSGHDVGMLIVDHRVWQGQVWRLLGSTLLHADIFHLAFNLGWLAVFGSRVEEAFGSLLTALWLAVFAVGSQAAEYALASGAVGLSGVVYGLLGFLWVLAKRDARFADAVNSQTTQLFILWFFFCLALSYAGVWPVANVAHAAGAGFGALAGLVMAPPSGYRRQLAAGALGCGVAAALAAGGFARPYVNLTGAVEKDLANQGREALERNDNQAAIDALEAAVRQRKPGADSWHNLGVAYWRASRSRDAARAFRRALELNPADLEARRAVEQLDSHEAGE